MKCEEIREKIIQFVDGDLTETEYQNIQKHLEQCNICRRDLVSIREIMDSARGIQIPQYDEAFWKARYDKIFEKATKRQHRLVFLRRLRMGFSFFMVLFILLVSSTYFHKNRQVNLINTTEIVYVPDEVLSEKPLLFSMDEMKNIIDILGPEDRMLIFAEYLH